MIDRNINKGLCVYAALLLLICTCACSKGNNSKANGEILVKIEQDVLTSADIDQMISPGLSADDSAKNAQAYIRAWINAKLASNIASKEIDMSAIDMMVENYRNELIMYEYTRRMYDAHANAFPEDSILSYYNQHKSEFVLNRPMVKGVYLKVTDGAKSLPTLRKLYRSQKSSDIDNLDKSELDGAVHYDYFRDNWVDWEQIESRIPYEFGESSDNFLKTHKNIDFSQGGFTYLLDITDVLHTGQEMPYQAAKQLIIDRLNYADRRAYEEQLRQKLLENAIEQGKITILCDLGINNN